MRYYGASCTMADCTFTGNTASQDVGGMFDVSSALTLTASLFTNTTATDAGGGISIFRSGSVVHVQNGRTVTAPLTNRAGAITGSGRGA